MLVFYLIIDREFRYPFPFTSTNTTPLVKLTFYLVIIVFALFLYPSLTNDHMTFVVRHSLDPKRHNEKTATIDSSQVEASRDDVGMQNDVGDMFSYLRPSNAPLSISLSLTVMRLKPGCQNMGACLIGNTRLENHSNLVRTSVVCQHHLA